MTGLFISCLNTLPVIKQYGYVGIGPWGGSHRSRNVSVKEVYDHQLRKNVVEFSVPRKNDFIRMTNNATRKSIFSDSLILKWKMKFDSPFKISIYVNTPQGRRLLNYTETEKDRIVVKRRSFNFYHGLGVGLRNGEWQTVVLDLQDLQSDLRDEDLATNVENVIEFRIQGKGRIDDIALQEEFGWVWQKQKLPAALFASALASYIFLFLSYGLFRLYPGNRNYFWALALLLLVNIIPFWQKFDYDSTAFFLKHTVAALVRQHDGAVSLTGRIHSILRWITIYSPFAAVLAVFFWGRFLVKKSIGRFRYFELLVGIFCIGGALLPGSRTAL